MDEQDELLVAVHTKLGRQSPSRPCWSTLKLLRSVPFLPKVMSSAKPLDYKGIRVLEADAPRPWLMVRLEVAPIVAQRLARSVMWK